MAQFGTPKLACRVQQFVKRHRGEGQLTGPGGGLSLESPYPFPPWRWTGAEILAAQLH